MNVTSHPPHPSAHEGDGDTAATIHSPRPTSMSEIASYGRRRVDATSSRTCAIRPTWRVYASARSSPRRTDRASTVSVSPPRSCQTSGMDGAIWGFVGVVVGGVITGILTLGTEVVRANKQADLDGAKRSDDRRLAMNTFQRETLLALQDAMNDLNGVVVKLMADRPTVADPGSLSRYEQTVNDYRLTSASVILLTTRVADDEVREFTTEFVKGVSALTRAGDDAERQEAFNVAGRWSGKAIQRSGELIRSTFVEAETR